MDPLGGAHRGGGRPLRRRLPRARSGADRLTPIRLRPYGERDLALSQRLESDPEVMRHLGGTRAPESIAEAHERRVEDPLWFVVETDPEGEAVGQIGIFAREHEGLLIREAGWTILPAFHGQGIATAALAEVLRRVGGEPGFDDVHAFPAAANGPSNALCRRAGFVVREEVELTLPGGGPPQLCRHWVLER